MSLAFHGLLLAALVAHGERLWSHTPPPGRPGFSSNASSSGGGGGPRVAYITLPSVPKAETHPAPRVPLPTSPQRRVPPPPAKEEPKPVETDPVEPQRPDTAAAVG